MAEFLRKFFGYRTLEDGSVVEYYIDGLGGGGFSDIRHFIWIGVTILLAFGFYFIFRKYKKAGRITTMIFAFGMFLTRLINQSVRAGIGAESPALRAFPWHLCTMMSFLLAIVILLCMFDKTKKLGEAVKSPIYTMAIMGGFITLLLGDYFDNKFLNFGALEGMAAHMLLIYIPIIQIATGDFKLEIKNIWKTNLGMLIMLGIATIANEVIFGIGYGVETNYMYVAQNSLPSNLGGNFYMLIYYALYVVLVLAIFGIPELYRHKKQQGQPIEKEPKCRKKAAILAIVLGAFGSQFFYLEKKWQGVVSMLVSISGVPLIIGIICGIKYLKASDEDFQKLYA